MKIIIQIICLLLLFNNPAIAARDRLLDNKDVCERYKGVWREFGNDCADNCHDEKTFLGLCAHSIVYSCDCGQNRCWNYNRCLSTKKYQKMVDKERERIRLEEERFRMEEELRMEEERLEKEAEKEIEDSIVNQEGSANLPPQPVQ